MNQLRKWADEHQYEAAPMQVQHTEDGGIIPQVHLISATPDPLGAVAAACRMYEGKPTYDLSDITDDERVRYFTQVQKTHLKAPLEFIDLHFFIEGVTRSFTHQMVRQRTAVYAQESLRFAVKDDDWSDVISLPPSLAGTKVGNLHDVEYGTQADKWRYMWEEAVREVEQAYKYLVESGMPAEDARGLMPHAMTTRLNYKTNLRNLAEHAGNRLCTQAQFEWRIVFMGIVNAIRNHHQAESECYDPECLKAHGSETSGINVPTDGRRRWHPDHDDSWQWGMIADSGIFRPICYQLGHCMFNADFDRSCTIRKRVDAFAASGVPSQHWDDDSWMTSEQNHLETINPSEWLLDPAAARKTSGGAGHD